MWIRLLVGLLALLTAPSALGQTITSPPGRYTAISGAMGHLCALGFDSKVTCWVDPEFPAGCFTPPDKTFSQLVSDVVTTCGLGTDGTITCWGLAIDANENIDCISWDMADKLLAGAPPAPPEVRYRSLAGLGDSLCAVTTGGMLVCRGYLNFVASSVHGIREAAAGGWHACVLDGAGQVSCIGPWAKLTTPDLRPPAGVVRALTMGEGMHCAIGASDELACWGPGLDVATRQSTASGLALFRSVACMSDARAPGCDAPLFPPEDVPAQGPPREVFNSAGEVVGTEEVYLDSVSGQMLEELAFENQMMGLHAVPKGRFQSVAIGGLDACGVTTDGTIRCWGVGRSDTFAEKRVPDPVAPERVTRVVPLGFGLCALGESGQIYCWDVPPGMLGPAKKEAVTPQASPAPALESKN